MLVDIHEGGVNNYAGWRQYSVDGCETLEDAAYAIVRHRHPFLTDDNHTWHADDGCVRVFRADSVSPPRIAPGWARHSYRAGAQWFTAVAFRAGVPGTPSPHPRGDVTVPESLRFNVDGSRYGYAGRRKEDAHG